MSFQVNFPPSDFGIPTVAIKSCGRLKNISHCIIPDTAIPYDFPNGTYSKLYAPKWLSLTVVGFTTLMSEIKTNMGILFNKVRFEIQSLPDQNMFIQPQTTWKCNVPDWKKTCFSIEHQTMLGKSPSPPASGGSGGGGRSSEASTTGFSVLERSIKDSPNRVHQASENTRWCSATYKVVVSPLTSSIHHLPHYTIGYKPIN